MVVVGAAGGITTEVDGFEAGVLQLQGGGEGAGQVRGAGAAVWLIDD